MRLPQGNVGRHPSILKRSGIIKGTTHQKPKVRKRNRRDWSLGIERAVTGKPPEDVREKSGKEGQGKREDGRRTYYSVQPSTAPFLP